MLAKKIEEITLELLKPFTEGMKDEEMETAFPGQQRKLEETFMPKLLTLDETRGSRR